MLVDVHGAADLRLFQLVNRDGGPAVDAAMRALSSRAFGVAAGVALGVALVAHLRRAAARPVLALAVAALLSDLVGARLLRPLLPRMRPCYALPPGTFRWLAPAADGPSLPSLHASTAVALALVATRAWPEVGAVAWLLALAVSVSRVYVGVHWPTDVLAGWIWGAIAGTLAWAVARKLTGAGAGAPGGGAARGGAPP